VFIFNEEAGVYNGYIPDLCIYAAGNTLEEVYADAEDLMGQFFTLCLAHEIDFNTPSTLEEVTDKWVGYKVSLLTAKVPD